MSHTLPLVEKRANEPEMPAASHPLTFSSRDNMDILEVQSRLAIAGLYSGAVDGIPGQRTTQGIEALFLARPYAKGDWRRWSAARRLVAAAQLFCMQDGIEVGEIDGLNGPQTRHAFEIYAARKRGIEGVESWRDAEQKFVPAASARADLWPRQTQREMEKFFGPVGANQATLVLPRDYPLKIAWDRARRVTRITCHEKIHDAAKRVLERALDHYGAAQIAGLGLDLFGGCLNVRRMRGGSAWSMHAWGAAFDFDPERNQLAWNRSRARFARPEYERWWALWEDEGFVSLGRARDFDWMHVQAARL